MAGVALGVHGKILASLRAFVREALAEAGMQFHYPVRYRVTKVAAADIPPTPPPTIITSYWASKEGRVFPPHPCAVMRKQARIEMSVSVRNRFCFSILCLH